MSCDHCKKRADGGDPSCKSCSSPYISRVSGKPGAKHFRKECQHVRNKGFTLNVALGEFLDFPIINASEIKIKIKKNSNNQITRIQIADN